MWLVLDHGGVMTGLSDERLSVRPARDTADGPEQDARRDARLRRVAAAAFSQRTAAGYRSHADTAIGALLDGCPDGPLDLMTAVCTPYPLTVLFDLLGIGVDDRADVGRWVTSLFGRPRGIDEPAALELLRQYLRAQLELRRRRPAADGLSAMLSCWRADGDLTEDELVSLCTMLLVAAGDSTAQLLGNCLLGLLSCPELLAGLHRDPRPVPAAVQELLRWDTSGPFSAPRWARADLELSGVTIPAGSQVVLSFLSANHDDSRHREPTRIRVDRPRAARNLAFGHGAHSCLGQALATMELEVAITQFAARFPSMRLEAPAGTLRMDVAPDGSRWAGAHAQRRLPCLPVSLVPLA